MNTQPQSITNKVKTFEDACSALNINPTNLLNEVWAPDEIAYIKLKVIAAALNEGWKPNWMNRSEWKYYPWFDLSSGSGLRYYDFDDRSSDSYVGSRLCFKTAELAEYAGNQFIDIYTDFLIYK